VRVLLRTFGCRANQYDTETVRAMVLAAGHELAEGAADADVAVFNSCAVTADAEADLRQQVRRAARENSALASVVMGCAAALPSSAAIAALPGVRAVVPGADFAAIARAVGLPSSVVGARPASQAGTRAVLRVQDGCDEHCTFCVTTLARGANRSRDMALLVDEASALADRHPEIVITGIHIGGYGADLGLSLGVLVEQLVDRVPRVRFRLSSVEATEVCDRLAELMRGAPDRLAPHLHAPLQSGADRVLRRMGRHWYSAATYRTAVERLAADLPHFGLGADVIAGFPGEMEEDHAATLALLEALPFTYLHVFPYSPRPGTAATRLPSAVAPEVTRRRARELRELGMRKAAAHRRRRDGGLADVVVLAAGRDASRDAGRDARRDAGREARLEGLTEDYLSVVPTNPTLPRVVRVAARLRLDGDRLLAESD
jgi:threonylcarbamoyladenosine tRNA methylthiotransferase MtaB